MLFAALASVTYAEDEPETETSPLSTANTVVRCGATDFVVGQQAAGDSPPMVLGEGVIWDPEVGEMPGIIVIWRDPNTHNFQITFTPNSNQKITCYISYGTDLKTPGQHKPK